MIVDDEPFNIESIMVVLQCSIPHIRNLGKRIDRALDGQEAVDLFKQTFTKKQSYSLILMDCNMPIKDGY